MAKNMQMFNSEWYNDKCTKGMAQMHGLLNGDRTYD